jgi:hypothetical protein
MIGNNKPVIRTEDPIATFLMSISHRGKLVASDTNIRTEAKSDYDSLIFAANMTSWETSRIQVWIDLTQIKPNWFVRRGSDLTVTVPASAIKTEAICTSHVDNTSSSWAFTFHPQILNELRQANQIQLNRQIKDQTHHVWLMDSDLATKDLTDLISTVLRKDNISVSAKIDMSH